LLQTYKEFKSLVYNEKNWLEAIKNRIKSQIDEKLDENSNENVGFFLFFF
jgi:hypothetical protein